MVSRIRSHSACVEDASAEYDRHGRALMDLVVHIVTDTPSSKQVRKQNRILIRFAVAMMATLRCAPREKSKVHLSDLEQLDDAQFDKILEGLQYMRTSARRLAARSKRTEPAH